MASWLHGESVMVCFRRQPRLGGNPDPKKDLTSVGCLAERRMWPQRTMHACRIILANELSVTCVVLGRSGIRNYYLSRQNFDWMVALLPSREVWFHVNQEEESSFLTHYYFLCLQFFLWNASFDMIMVIPIILPNTIRDNNNNYNNFNYQITTTSTTTGHWNWQSRRGSYLCTRRDSWKESSTQSFTHVQSIGRVL